MDWLMDPHAWVGFATLLALEIVLGIDNVVFISILAGKLPASQQAKASPSRTGLGDGDAHCPASFYCLGYPPHGPAFYRF